MPEDAPRIPMATERPQLPPIQEGHVWDTKRLRVYQQTVIAPDGVLCQVFNGWHLESWMPRSVVTATIGGRAEPYLPVGLVLANVWWIVTDDDFLREGLALELLESIHNNWAWLQMDGVTKAGRKLTKAFKKRNYPVPYTPPSPEEHRK